MVSTVVFLLFVIVSVKSLSLREKEAEYKAQKMELEAQIKEEEARAAEIEELGGYVNITVLVIVVTGVLGNILAEPVLKLFRIQEPIAKGLALGSSAHAIGTAKAMELGEIEGAMSSLSIAVAGILTVFGASVFSWIYSVL